jgi:hypothetical protein
VKVVKPRSPLAWISYVLCVAQLLSAQIDCAVLAATASSDGTGSNNNLSLAEPALTPEKPVMAPVPSAQDKKKASTSPVDSASTASPAKTDGAKANQPTPPASAAAGASPAAPAKSTSSPTDLYPTLGRMEGIVFGAAKPEIQVEKRLADLEQATFKETYPNQTLFDRSQRLKGTILGSVDEASTSDLLGTGLDALSRLAPKEPSKPPSFLEEIANRPENAVAVDDQEIQRFALELVNYLRSEMALAPFTLDPTATKMAQEQVADLAKRNLVSHANSGGANPDLRYTKSGGTDAVTETILSLSGASSEKKTTRSQVAQLMKTMLEREDDREAVMSIDATGLGFSTAYMSNNSALLGCLEVVTKHGAMQTINEPISVGDKVDLKGTVEGPYHFERITLAWEGKDGSMVSSSDESQDALPYFPPLDYIAYASHAEHDYEKAVSTLKTIGLIACIAGGVFMPPVALAAPLIAMSGSMQEPKPMSDIPVRGGVKTDGSNFSAHIPVSKEGKNGIYYVTVWASGGRGGKLIPISRRAYIVSPTHSPTDGKENGQKKHPDQAEL